MSSGVYVSSTSTDSEEQREEVLETAKEHKWDRCQLFERRLRKWLSVARMVDLHEPSSIVLIDHEVTSIQ